MAFAREAWPFVLPFGLLAGLLVWFRHPAWGAAAGVAALCVLLFFRIPARDSPDGSGLVLSAANGKVLSVARLPVPEIGPGTYLRIATFLSVFDVHVQRSPVAGRVVSITHSPGAKVAAFRTDADRVNESRLLVLESAGELFAVRQIVGLVARRIATWVDEGSALERGQAYGIIKFGSRVDVFIPDGYTPVVRPGNRVVEGLTILARREGS
jgi:phosphatidylserine decarboxylase